MGKAYGGSQSIYTCDKKTCRHSRGHRLKTVKPGFILAAAYKSP